MKDEKKEKSVFITNKRRKEWKTRNGHWERERESKKRGEHFLI